MSGEDDEDVEIGLAGQAREQSQFSSDELAGAEFEPESDDDKGYCAWEAVMGAVSLQGGGEPGGDPKVSRAGTGRFSAQ